MPIEKQNKLVDLSVAFAVEILNLVKYLKEQRETIISNQIGRAGTGIAISTKHKTLQEHFVFLFNSLVSQLELCRVKTE